MHLFLHVQWNRLLHSRGTLVLFFNGYSCWITRASCSNHLFLGWTNFNCTNQRHILAAGWFRQTLGKRKCFLGRCRYYPPPPPKSPAAIAGQTKKLCGNRKLLWSTFFGEKANDYYCSGNAKVYLFRRGSGNYLRTANWKYGISTVKQEPDTHDKMV